MSAADCKVVDGEHNVIWSSFVFSHSLPADHNITVGQAIWSWGPLRADQPLRGNQVVGLLLRLLSGRLDNLDLHVCLVWARLTALHRQLVLH